MDNEYKDVEDALKAMTPKAPSHGARWSLDQRIADLEQPANERRTRPRLLMVSSVAASVIIAVCVWAWVNNQPSTTAEPSVADTPSVTTETDDPVVASNPDEPQPVMNENGMEFVRDEGNYPSTIPFEIKRHVTEVKDLGIVRVPDQPPMRRVRREYVRELLVKDPETGKTYKVQKPESETILIRMDEY